ncbi:hypothetical protein N7450_007406 [Penicillium hetheringtonii]|uniref:Uncharacterized protein n=1 Tax=Penicillium hetheringtonii TaxID=911720 RepID=A0AAD6DJ10_9EURO|nr:hypothetical protein N7450_007406 [Penicillium hetheringtonii]
MVSSCPDPFVDESLFANTGGVGGVKILAASHAAFHVQLVIGDGRMSIHLLANKLTIIGLVDDIRLALWPSIPVFIALVWLLATYAIFPAAVTERHYLNVAPVIGLMCISRNAAH